MENEVVTEVNVGGRPTVFTEELGETICTWVAETSMGLRKICAELGLCYSTVSKWTLPGSTSYKPDFRELYLAAKVQQADVLAEELLEIADDMANDTITQPDGRVVQNRVHVARCKLRIAVRQWLMGRLAPKRWGTPLQLGQEPEAPVERESNLWNINGHVLDWDDETLVGEKFGNWMKAALAVPGPYKNREDAMVPEEKPAASDDRLVA